MQALIQEQQEQKERFQTDLQTGMAEQLKTFADQLKELKKDNESVRAIELKVAAQQRPDSDQNAEAAWIKATANLIDTKFLTQYGVNLDGKRVDKDQTTQGFDSIEQGFVHDLVTKTSRPVAYFNQTQIAIIKADSKQ